jgi:hypothetical protein
MCSVPHDKNTFLLKGLLIEWQAELLYNAGSMNKWHLISLQHKTESRLKNDDASHVIISWYTHRHARRRLAQTYTLDLKMAVLGVLAMITVLMMEAVRTSETSVNSYQFTRFYNPEYSRLHSPPNVMTSQEP